MHWFQFVSWLVQWKWFVFMFSVLLCCVWLFLYVSKFDVLLLRCCCCVFSFASVFLVSLLAIPCVDWLVWVSLLYDGKLRFFLPLHCQYIAWAFRGGLMCTHIYQLLVKLACHIECWQKCWVQKNLVDDMSLRRGLLASCCCQVLGHLVVNHGCGLVRTALWHLPFLPVLMGKAASVPVPDLLEFQKEVC